MVVGETHHFRKPWNGLNIWCLFSKMVTRLEMSPVMLAVFPMGLDPSHVTSTCFTNVGGWTNPIEKYARQNGFIFLNFRGKNRKYLSCHHLVQHWLDVCWMWSNQPPFCFFIFRWCCPMGLFEPRGNLHHQNGSKFSIPASTWWPRKCFRRCKDSQQTLWTSGDHGGWSKFRA